MDQEKLHYLAIIPTKHPIGRGQACLTPAIVRDADMGEHQTGKNFVAVAPIRGRIL